MIVHIRLAAASAASSLAILLVACGVTANDSNGWILANKYNFAPHSRTIDPESAYAMSGNVLHAQPRLEGGETRINGQNSEITFDFGYEVAGIVSIAVTGTSDARQMVGIAFSESSRYVGRESDLSGTGIDGALSLKIQEPGSYTISKDKLRGGFRYITIFLESDGWVDLHRVSVNFTASPAMRDLRSYPNYFLSNDDLLNRIWYAGAYTVQLDTIDPHQGHVWPSPTVGWENDAVISEGTSVLVDGAKRDRNVWPGDLGISQPTAFVSTGDTASTRAVLDILFNEQDSQGGLPYCGPPMNCGTASDTYHLWTLIASADYYRETRDRAWLDGHWQQYKTGIQFSLNKIDSNGLFSITLPADWLRSIPLSGENLSPNVLLYRALAMGAYLAIEEKDSPTAQGYISEAAVLKRNINSVFWDDAIGKFRDAPGEDLYPQDGNALAVWFQAADSPTRAMRVSRALRSNWNTYGAQTPERLNAIATFPGSMEVLSHFVANDDQTALDLIRREWGYMLNSPLGTKSTFWEGYLSDGSFDYGGAFMSTAHGWATGPTSALTYYALGIMPATDSSVDFTLIPHPGDLIRIEGRLGLAKGPVKVTWARHLDTSTFTLRIETAPVVAGLIGVPTFGRRVRIRADGRVVWDGCATNPMAFAGPFRIWSDGLYVYFEGAKGNHVFESNAPCG